MARGGARRRLGGCAVRRACSPGNALDAARRRARSELTALLERAPRIAHRRRDGLLEEVPVDALRPGDIVAVRPGEVVPVDGVVDAGEAVLDEAAMTGESLPVTRGRGEPAHSGSANAGLLSPLAGAFLQEGIDVAVILNALRALRG